MKVNAPNNSCQRRAIWLASERARKIAPAKVRVPQLKSVSDHMLWQLMEDLDDLLLKKGRARD